MLHNAATSRKHVGPVVLSGGAFGACEHEGAGVGRMAVSPHAAKGGITVVNACIYIGKPGATSNPRVWGSAPCSEAVPGPSLYPSFDALSVALLELLTIGCAPSVRWSKPCTEQPSP